VIIPPIADGLGTSADEVVSSIMILVAVVTGVAGFQRFPGEGKAASRTRIRSGWVLLALSVALLVSAFIVPQRYLRPRIAKVRPRSTAQVAIVEPPSGAVVHGRALRVDISIKGARIISQATTKLRPDEGHVHIMIDGVLIGTAFGPTADVDLSGFRPGMHTLSIEFVAGDHFPFNPRVIVSEPFTLAA
jgi:hypothetical protein